MAERFQIRSDSRYDWLPKFCIVDTKREVRVAAYDDELAAVQDCADRNREEAQQ